MTAGRLPDRLPVTTFMQPSVDIRAMRTRLIGMVDLHWHDFYELVTVESGTGTHIVNGKSFEVVPGNAFLLTPSDFHQVGSQGSELSIFNVIFSPRVLTEDLESLLFREESESGPLLAERLGRANPLLERMTAESSDGGLGSAIALEGLLRCVLVELARCALREGRLEAEGGTNHMHEGVRRALTYVERHFREPLCLEQVADSAHLSPNYFSQLFRQAVGMSFQQHLQLLRLRFAESLVRATDLPITDICYASGFRTLSHFERAFRQQCGFSPTSMRRREENRHQPSSA